MSTETFTVTGMTCDHCKRAVTTEHSGLDRAQVAAAVDEAGYELA
jgi:copper chaperone CopZ